MIENTAANAARFVAPGGSRRGFGRQVVAGERALFTVIRRTDGKRRLRARHHRKGKAPFHPYQIKGDAKMVLANERIEVHTAQREFRALRGRFAGQGIFSSRWASTAPKRSTSW